MKIKSLLSIATLSVLTTAASYAAQTPADIAAAKPDPNGNLVGLKTANGKLVYNFIDLWFNQHKQSEAWDTYVARKGYMNHAVNGANASTVNRTYEEEKAAEAQAGSGAHFDIKQIVAQGNLVFVHIAATRSGGGEGPAAAGGANQGPPPSGDSAMGAAPNGAPPSGNGAGAPPAGEGMSAAGMGGGAPGGAAGGSPANGDGAGPRELIMILRVKDGKMVDHWDMHVATNSNSVVFEGLDRKIP